MGWHGDGMNSQNKVLPLIKIALFLAFLTLSLHHQKMILILKITKSLPESPYFWEMRRLEEISLGSLIRKRKEREFLKRRKAI